MIQIDIDHRLNVEAIRLPVHADHERSALDCRRYVSRAPSVPFEEKVLCLIETQQSERLKLVGRIFLQQNGKLSLNVQKLCRNHNDLIDGVAELLAAGCTYPKLCVVDIVE